ncbi:hypothetical protein CCHR01_14575 [Colletotrichum chrysophilum]|uniref:Uncharacterized protein n=1 Tax=Colletotrichum chrysophilum TaxID=1836956 RepID=A0AAD9A784_9PEZI|nr:hypothetical protein CCHR01_14575 [Colletotrichum chrysophilum]
MAGSSRGSRREGKGQKALGMGGIQPMIASLMVCVSSARTHAHAPIPRTKGEARAMPGAPRWEGEGIPFGGFTTLSGCGKCVLDPRRLLGRAGDIRISVCPRS